jgi:hypothetical protein
VNEMSEDIEKIFDDLYAKGLTDGLPVIPPTRERVKKMLEFTDKKPDDSLGRVPPAEYEATVESVAANAVMAGCRPEYFPVVAVALEATLDRPNLRAALGTTGPCWPLAICNGPSAKEVDLASGWAYLASGPDRRANMTIGRAITLSLQNIGRSRPGITEKKPLDHINRRGMCFAEAEDKMPASWEPLHVERGFERETSTVTVKGEVTLRSHGLPGGRSSGIFKIDSVAWAKALIPKTAHGIQAKGTTGIFIMTPNQAKYWADNGMSKDDLRQFFYETCRMAYKEWYPDYPAESREDILRTAFARVPDWMRDLDLVPLFPNYGRDLWFVVAGGDPVRCAVSLGDHGDDPVITKPITFANGEPVKSVYDFKHHK